jgi:hypothetical protein
VKLKRIKPEWLRNPPSEKLLRRRNDCYQITNVMESIDRGVYQKNKEAYKRYKVIKIRELSL